LEQQTGKLRQICRHSDLYSPRYCLKRCGTEHRLPLTARKTRSMTSPRWHIPGQTIRMRSSGN
jgi:hypothetical protein